MKTIDKISLKDWERKALREAFIVLKERFLIESVILFGSKARGDDDTFSDIDLLIITKQPLHWKEEKTVVESLFDVGIKHGVIFSPLFVSSEEWNGGLFTEFPIYTDIIKDGAMIA